MKNFELLHVNEPIRKAIRNTAESYSRFLGLRFDILEVQGNAVTVRVEQVSKTTDQVFTQKELVEKAKEVFSHLPEGYQVRVRALVFAGTGMDAVSAEWVKHQLKRYDKTQADLCQDLGIDRPAMSKVLSNATGFTRWHKAAFFYYFKSLDRKSN